ncbi:hypothetical protein CCYA_CCYA19G4720 [Cyanidiococcus yangmingshanensis]|nr:hypothetical protein CCYA_CCYA19G4720 [Cyanidiococcus yangmingshanensis]
MQAGDLPKSFILFSWLTYVAVVLCSDALPGSSVFRVNHQVVQEASELSLNFWLILPLLRPEQAPVLHPLLESTFQVVVSWAMLFFGFLSDDWGRHWRKEYHRLCRQQLPMWIFLVGSALLTNVFYLPYLVIRRPLTSVTVPTNQASPKGVSSERNEQKDEMTAQSSAPDWLLRVGESRALPLLLSTMVLVAVFWAFGGRPTYPAAPPFSIDRLTTYAHDILQKDRLAVSFPIDMLVFAIFQAVLVPDDMRRRGIDPQSTQGKRWIHRARWIPFFGVAWYLWSRPRLPDWPKS